MEFLFILHYLSFLSVSVKRCEKITKGVHRVVVHSTDYVTKQPLAPRDVISNTPAVNRQIDFDVFRMYFAIIQLLYHVNALVNKCQ